MATDGSTGAEMIRKARLENDAKIIASNPPHVYDPKAPYGTPANPSFSQRLGITTPSGNHTPGSSNSTR